MFGRKDDIIILNLGEKYENEYFFWKYKDIEFG